MQEEIAINSIYVSLSKSFVILLKIGKAGTNNNWNIGPYVYEYFGKLNTGHIRLCGISDYKIELARGSSTRFQCFKAAGSCGA